jgi:alkanesulfonate monooxygenase SsuD/methylene tetrahydromethanopterin reductase-like flavin-dependent oxidoreductase (luciferase family)
MIKSWAFEFFPEPQGLIETFSDGSKKEQPDPRKTTEYFNFYLDLWARAEQFGYHGIFLSEHHFGGGYSPSPNLILPVIAQRTKTLRLGVMGNVVPYHNPWRLVEEFGMLDHMTGGRFEIGTSSGIPAEFERIGMSTAEARARYDEAIQIIDAGLKAGVVNHSGKYWNFQNLPLVPRPLQQPEPPKWTTVVSVESARKAARRGSKITTGFLSTDDAKKVFDAYKEEAGKAGNPAGPEQLGLRRQVIMDFGDSAPDTASQYAQGFRNLLETVDKRTIAPGRKALDQPGTHGYALGDEEFIHGKPDGIAAEIVRQCKVCGAGHFLVTFAGHQSLDQLAAAWEMFGTEVIPALNRA